MPRKACVPSGISGAVVSAAKAPEMRTALSSGRHSPSRRLTRLTAGPMAVKSSRSAAPILPQSISPRCSATPKGRGAKPSRASRLVEMRHAGPRGGDRLERGVASVARRPAGDRKDRQHAVAHEFEHFAAESVHGAGDAIEPGVEGGDDRGRRSAFGQGREAAQVGEQERRLDGLADAAPQRTGQHARRAAPAEIGFERRAQRRSRGEGGERRRREARRLSQAVGLVGGERTLAHPAQFRPVRGRSDRVFMQRAGCEARKPAPAGLAGGPSAPEKPPAANPSASITSPLPARHSQVRRATSGCGAASVRAPPASGAPSSIRRWPRFARKSSDVGVSAAASTSQARVEESGMARSSAGLAFVVISVSVSQCAGRPPFRWSVPTVIQPNG